ncbi:MAG: transglycosylase SLT domain-containing protein, partial [Pseudomonadota bacterium]
QTIRNWVRSADPEQRRVRYRNCGTDCQDPNYPNFEINSRTPYFPLKIYSGGSDGMEGQIVWLSIRDLIHAGTHKQLNSVRVEPKPEPPETFAIPSEHDTIENAEGDGEGSETTTGSDEEFSTSAPSHAPPPLKKGRVPVKPAVEPTVTAPTDYGSFQCENGTPTYTHVDADYVNKNCFKRAGKGLKATAEIIMQNVVEINKRRGVTVDPRYMACIAYRESEFAPNAKSDDKQDFGLYQVRNSTGRRILQTSYKRSFGLRPVTEGFENLKSWEAYKDMMYNNILAQTDLAHNWLVGNARHMKDSPRSYSCYSSGNPLSSSNLQCLARVYNGGTRGYKSAKATRYGSAIMSCYNAMKSVANSRGQVTSSESSLRSALRKAKQ